MKKINTNLIVSIVIFFFLWFLPSFVFTAMISCDCNLQNYGYIILGFSAVILIVAINQLSKINLFQKRFAILLTLSILLYIAVVVFLFTSKWAHTGGITF
jgi:hypothetical protein